MTAAMEQKKLRISELENCLEAVEQTERDLRSRVEKIEEMETKLREKTAVHRLQVNDLENSILQLRNEKIQLEEDGKAKDVHIHQLRGELEALEHQISAKDRKISELQLDLSNCDTSEELEDKRERIEELEEALRESVQITAEREVALDSTMKQKALLEEQVARLEQRLQSLHNAQSLKCPSCRPNRQKLHEVESRLSKLLAERRSHLHELFDMKQEALEAAISERDAQLALLEVSGIKTAKAAEQADHLKADRKRLMEQMKEQNERRVKLLQEYEDPFTDASLLSNVEDS